MRYVFIDVLLIKAGDLYKEADASLANHVIQLGNNTEFVQEVLDSDNIIFINLQNNEKTDK